VTLLMLGPIAMSAVWIIVCCFDLGCTAGGSYPRSHAYVAPGELKEHVVAALEPPPLSGRDDDRTQARDVKKSDMKRRLIQLGKSEPMKQQKKQHEPDDQCESPPATNAEQPEDPGHASPRMNPFLVDLVGNGEKVVPPLALGNNSACSSSRTCESSGYNSASDDSGMGTPLPLSILREQYVEAGSTGGSGSIPPARSLWQWETDSASSDGGNRPTRLWRRPHMKNETRARKEPLRKIVSPKVAMEPMLWSAEAAKLASIEHENAVAELAMLQQSTAFVRFGASGASPPSRSIRPSTTAVKQRHGTGAGAQRGTTVDHSEARHRPASFDLQRFIRVTQQRYGVVVDHKEHAQHGASACTIPTKRPRHIDQNLVEGGAKGGLKALQKTLPDDYALDEDLLTLEEAAWVAHRLGIKVPERIKLSMTPPDPRAMDLRRFQA
jgi:hypothetical protein